MCLLILRTTYQRIILLVLSCWSIPDEIVPVLTESTELREIYENTRKWSQLQLLPCLLILAAAVLTDMIAYQTERSKRLAPRPSLKGRQVVTTISLSK